MSLLWHRCSIWNSAAATSERIPNDELLGRQSETRNPFKGETSMRLTNQNYGIILLSLSVSPDLGGDYMAEVSRLFFQMNGKLYPRRSIIIDLAWLHTYIHFWFYLLLKFLAAVHEEDTGGIMDIVSWTFTNPPSDEDKPVSCNHKRSQARNSQRLSYTSTPAIRLAPSHSFKPANWSTNW